MRVKYVQHTLFKSYRLYPILLPRMFQTSCCTFQSEYVFTRQIQVRSFCLNAMLPFSASIPHQPGLDKAWDLAIFKEDLTHLCFPATKTGGKRGPLSSDGSGACSRADAWAFELCRTESQDLALAWVKTLSSADFFFNLSRSTTQLTSLTELWFWQWFCCSSLAHMVRLWWPFIYSLQAKAIPGWFQLVLQHCFFKLVAIELCRQKNQRHFCALCKARGGDSGGDLIYHKFVSMHVPRAWWFAVINVSFDCWFGNSEFLSAQTK